MTLKMHIIRCTIFSIGFLYWSWADAQTTLETFNYAGVLFHSQNYEQAIIELERVNLFTDSLKKESLFLMGECYEKLNDYEKAISCFKSVINLEYNDSLKKEYQLKVIFLHIKNDEPIYALVDLNTFNSGSSEYFTRKKLFFKMVGHYKLGNYKESSECVYPLSAFYPEFDTTYVESLFRKLIELKSANIKKYGVMSSFLPGLGQVADGEYTAGVNSFLLNAFLITSFVVTIHRLSFLDAFLSYYTLIRRYYYGGILNAKENAKSKIERKKTELMDDLLTYFEKKTMELESMHKP